MRRFMEWLRGFFFPPSGAPTWQRVLPYAVLGVLTLLVLTGSVYAWDYTNSPTFCGETCHTMPPEYTSYLTSPHARIDCVECHIGRGFIATRISRKAGDLQHVSATLFQTYEFPIRAKKLRPARETCEKCHFPEKFSDDSLRKIKRFENDVPSTPKTTYLVLKTGGGSKRMGLGRGIHWHIVNTVEYYPVGEVEQEIPYVRVIEDDGSITEYLDIESDFDPTTLNQEELVEMDCITCHNRITHLVTTPEDTVDQLIDRGLISSEIPEIRLKAVEVYGNLYDSTEKGLNGIAGLANYYQTYYPDFYSENSKQVKSAIAVLQDAYAASVFPDQNSNWNTHPNNVGHKDFPGCFRCHDGKHLNDQEQAIRLECNVCHSIPVVADPSDFVADIEISRGPEPESHKNQNWISMHHDAFNPSCENCHTTGDPGGTGNTSFCSNSACHGIAWKYAGFNAPKLREIVAQQLPPTPTPIPLPDEGPLTYSGAIGELFEARCASCHGPSSAIQGLDLSEYSAALQGGESGPAVLPGDPQGSLVVQKQAGDTPHFGQFSPQELELVIDWIESGAPE